MPAYSELRQALAPAQSLLLCAHVGPDGDTLGSMLGMAFAFRTFFPQLTTIHPVIAGTLPEVYSYLPGLDQVRDVETAKDLLPRYDAALSVDCGSLDRLGPAQPFFEAAGVTINIDHHVSNDAFATVNVLETDAAASGQVVERILRAWDTPLTSDIATCLYTALVTDTGGFRFSNVTPEVFELAARLVAAGANPETIFKAIYENTPRPQALIHANGVLTSEHTADHSLVWTTVTQADLAKVDAKEEYLEGLIDQLRHIQGVKIAALFKETKDGGTKVSLRSNVHGIDVAAVVTPLGGGGHTMAAGLKLDEPVEAVKAKLLLSLESLI